MIAIVIATILTFTALYLKGIAGAYLMGVATTLLMFGITRYQEQMEREERYVRKKNRRDNCCDYDLLDHCDKSAN